MNKIIKKIMMIFAMISLCVMTITGCAAFESEVNDIKGTLIGNSFNCKFYDNYGELSLTVNGQKIGMSGNTVKESIIESDGTTGIAYSLSSVVTINIDGDQIQSCGDTVIFEESGLNPDTDFQLEDIDSYTNGNLSDNTSISGIVNKYKNYFGKSRIVVIESQLGVPICAYSGNDVYWEVRDDLPKTTKLMIDGKALYIHRANFQIIDKALLAE